MKTVLACFALPFLALAALLAGGGAANAAQSGWARSEGGRVRLVALPEAKDGVIRAALDLRLEPGWKTYWREPGASGIPPEVSFGRDSGIEFSGLSFPPPKAFDDGVVRYTGYDRSVAFPFTLKRKAASHRSPLHATVFLGICKEICIPLQAELTVDPSVETDPLEEALVSAAEAALPEKPGKDFSVTAATLDADRGTLRLELTVPAVADAGSPDFFLSGPSGYGFGPARDVELNGTRLKAAIPVTQHPRRDPAGAKSIVLAVGMGGRTMETSFIVNAVELK